VRVRRQFQAPAGLGPRPCGAMRFVHLARTLGGTSGHPSERERSNLADRPALSAERGI
jgi:hypothetical protein